MAEPAGIDVSIEVDTTTVTVTSEEAVNVAIAPETTSVSVASAMGPASSIASVAYATISATNIQTALEQLADQFYRQSATPSGSNLAEGDLWYDTTNEELRVYREISAGTYEWQALVSGGYVSGQESEMDKLDGGRF